MKRLFTRAWLVLSLLTVGALCSYAQQDTPIPVDKDVKIGKLENGLTYYIRHNETPKGQADFYIAQKVGSILEEDHQRGLAHFLEHMCFNGTTNFPGSKLIDWLASIGVKFGQNLNAYTSIEQTVYNISNVPIARESVQDSCLLILHDWANDLLLEPEEIDKERGVIHQEWRRSMVGQMRILENLLPKMYPDSRYGYRLPIGTMEVVDNFPPQAIRDYYETWYRPDQQGIIVVGDIDVDRIEAKIKEMFSSIEMPADAKPREYLPVADNEQTIYAIGADKEQQMAIASIMFKSEPFPSQMKGFMSYLVYDYMTDMATMMLNNRFSEMMSNPDVPFAQAGASFGEYMVSKTKSAFDLQGVAKDGNILPVVEAMYREVLRAKKGGFTEGEYQRARSEYLSRIEKTYNSRNNTQSAVFVQQYVDNFLDNEPIPSIEDTYSVMQMLAPNIPVALINQVFAQLIGDTNRVILALLPEKEGLAIPTEAQIAEVMAKVDGEDIAPYVDEMKDEPLIPALPKAGTIVEEKHNVQWDATELTLSNGVKVIVKPTKFKEGEILMRAVAKGGTSTISDEYNNELIGLPYAMSQNSLGTYTNSDLQKYLSGKQASVSLSLGNYERTVRGSTVPKDLPTMMELLYATFTEFGIDADEFKALQNQYAGILENQQANPQFIFQDNLMKTLFSNPRQHMITADIMRSLNREKIVSLVKQLTANAADYEFIFVGDIDMNQMRELLAQYVATLPADRSKATTKAELNASLEMKNGIGVDTFTTKMETPQTYVFFVMKATLDYTSKESRLADIAGQILANRLLKTVREEMGAVYSISAIGSLTRSPGANATLQSSFPMKPEFKEEVLKFISEEIKKMESDVTAEELNKSIEFMVKTATEGKERNDNWISAISGYAMNGVDTFNGNVEVIKSITIADVQDYVKRLRAAGNYRVVVLDPAE